MSKARVTRKWIALHYQCVSVAYCGLSDLLQFHKAQFYTCGVYGWNFDCYTFQIHGVDYAITTGDRGMIDNCKKNQKNSSLLANEYNNKAREILDSRVLSWKKKEYELEKLLTEFLYQVFSIED